MTTILDWAKQQRAITLHQYTAYCEEKARRGVYGSDDKERTLRRTHVAWNYAVIELESAAGWSDVGKHITEWRDRTATREDLAMNDGNRELRDLMVGVANEILQHLQA